MDGEPREHDTRAGSCIRFFGRLVGFVNSKDVPVPKIREISPEYHAGFFSTLTFSWLSPLIAKGYRRPLQLNDIWLVNPDRSTKKLATEFKARFKENIAHKKTRPILRTMWHMFQRDIIIGAIGAFVYSSSQVIMPLVLKYIIAFAENAYYGQHALVGKGVGLVMCLVILQILGSFGSAQMFYLGMMMGAQTRSALISIIFDKAMTISGHAKAGNRNIEDTPSEFPPGSEQEKNHFVGQLEKDQAEDKKQDDNGWTNARIINIMSVDTYRVDQACGWFQFVWSSPLGLIVTITILIVNLTYSALPGIGIFLFSVPAAFGGMLIMVQGRKAINKITDERITVTQDLLSSIRLVKYLAWESSFLQRLRRIRKQEIGGIRRTLGVRNFVNTIGNIIPVLGSIVSFITYYKTKKVLNSASVFSSLALFNQLRMPLLFLPFSLAMVVDAVQSINRIENFLTAEDAPLDEPLPKTQHMSIDIRGASFTWENSKPPDPYEGLPTREPTEEEMKEMKFKEMGKKKGNRKGGKVPKQGSESPLPEEQEKPAMRPFSIQDVNLHVDGPELIGIIGAVGSGKSSLLSAVVGEMRQTTGSSKVRGRKALCLQVPWIQSLTIRENITFGQEFDQAKYDRVIGACALGHDLGILPHGSSTEIGERGINLSGGQKHRLSLARAIYFDPDIVLLDDPLAAVDADTGNHLMEHAICGLLKNTCRLLATHQVQHLYRCDRVIVMDNGRIVACDTLDNLLRRDDATKRILQAINSGSGHEKGGTGHDPEKNPSHHLQNGDKPGDVLMQEEERHFKGISWEVYRGYFSMTGSLLVPVFVLATLVAFQASNIITSLWLAWWSSAKYKLDTNTYIGIYVGLGGAQALLQFVSMLALSLYATEASKQMYQRATNRLMHAPVSFFDTTPMGRIMSRLSKDIDTMDNNLSESVRMAATTLLSVLSIVGLTIAYFYYFAIALVPVIVIYTLTSAYYRASAREIKRIEGILRSPIFTLFSEAVSGTTTLRAYGETGRFSKRLIDAIDNMASAYYLSSANVRWVTLRLDAIGVIFLLVTGILVVTNKLNVSPSISGLVLSYLVSITQTLMFSVRQMSEVENSMTAVERVHHYVYHIPQEASAKTLDFKLSEQWPAKGEIIFKNVQMRYRDGLPLVLMDLNLHVRSSERLGIVGRTGAGKSSIMAVLFRIVEPVAGSITIDGIDTTTIGLHDLRSRISIVPQDATLIRGTVRSNLDPSHQKPDEQLWEVLQQAHLRPAAPIGSGDSESNNNSGRNGLTLDTPIEPEGSNLSHGQRQLLALARALVRNSQIIVADEATSAIDYESDATIQQTMATAFRGKTVLCIAHRLRTILSYDRVCVMDDGRVAQLGAPLDLYDDATGRFRQLCEDSHITREDIIAAATDPVSAILGRDDDKVED